MNFGLVGLDLQHSHDILDMDKIAAGQMSFDMREEAIGELTQQAIDANQAYAEKFNTSIILAKPIDKSILVKLDSARYAQVLSNLLSNAAKFSPQGKNIEVIISETDTNTRISVKDYGEGIPKEFRSKIFGKFEQADSSDTRSKSGTGLGLYITKQIVGQMGGEIGFNTRANKGTTFWVEFPIIHKDIQGSEDAQSADGDVLNVVWSESDLPTILHIEDDLDLSSILSEALRGKAEIINAPTLVKAKQLLKQKQFSTIILDIGLPDGSGLEILDQIPKLSRGSTPPILVLSVNEFPSTLRNKVSEVIIKSRVSETKIVEVILYLLKTHKKGENKL